MRRDPVAVRVLLAALLPTTFLLSAVTPLRAQPSGKKSAASSIASTTTSASASASAAPSMAVSKLGSSLTGPAKDAYESGRILYEAGDPAGAEIKFRVSYDLSHDARLLWNMAVCEKTQRHYHRTELLIERYLADGGDLVTDEQRTTAQETLRVIHSLVGALTLIADPSGALVFIDNEREGIAPLTKPIALDLGKHVIRLEKPGYVTTSTSIEIVGGAASSLTLQLAPEALDATLTIIAGAADTIHVDGRVVGSGEWEGTLSPGPHDVRVSGLDKTDFEQHLVLPPKGTRVMRVQLENARAASAWPWIVGAAVVVTGLTIGGYFLLRPKERDASQTSGTLDPGQVSLPLFGK